MKIYNFYINRNNNLICSIESPNKTRIYKNNDAYRILKKLDNSSLNYTPFKQTNEKYFFRHGDDFVVKLFNVYGLNKWINRYERNNKKVKSGNIITKGKIVPISASAIVIAMIVSINKPVDKNIVKQENYVERIETTYDNNIASLNDDEVNYDNNINEDNINNEEITIEEDKDNSYVNNINSNQTINNIVEDSNIYYSDASNDTKAYENTDQYDEYINKASSRWGISSELLKAMMTQESAGDKSHNKLMGFEFTSWKDVPLTVHNFDTDEDETIVFTDNPSNYNVDHTISSQDLTSPYTQIVAAAIVLQIDYKYYNNNMLLAIQAYNNGTSNLDKIIEYESSVTGRSVEDIINDKTSDDFLNYTNLIMSSNGTYGDDKYLTHVMSHAKDNSSFYILDSNEKTTIRH